MEAGVWFPCRGTPGRGPAARPSMAKSGGAEQHFFLFEVSSLELAKAFINAPDTGDTAEASGVTEGEYPFLEEGSAYFSEVT